MEGGGGGREGGREGGRGEGGIHFSANKYKTPASI